jgi:HD domain
MTMPQVIQAGEHANPHALASIMRASEHCEIVAQEDIVDEHGAKLWARNQPVSRELQHRLLERKLRQPLESCLRAANGVTHAELAEIARGLIDREASLHSAVSPWAAELLADIPQLPLHAVVQLLLTAARSSLPGTFDHAIRGMLVAGAMAAHAGGDRYQQRISMLGGLLHDLGELYIQPDYLLADCALSPTAWRHIVVHPKVGEMLLQRQTDYPKELSRAVGEHHERGNGMGYPARARHLSWLGCRLSAMETFLGVLASGRPEAWEHASLAARIVPGEFDASAVAFASQAARRHQGHSHSDNAPPQGSDAAAVWDKAQSLKQGIQWSLREAWVLSASSGSDKVSETARTVTPILEQLMRACHALGLWAPRHLAGDALDELHLACQEIGHRLRSLERMSCWMDDAWSPQESEALSRLWPGAFAGATR